MSLILINRLDRSSPDTVQQLQYSLATAVGEPPYGILLALDGLFRRDLTMRTIWVLVADRARARIFECRGASGPLVEIADLIHPQSRRPAHLVDTGAPGRINDRFGGARHALVPRKNKKAFDVRMFAREISDYLTRACRARNFDRLYLLAEPRVLGALRPALDTATRRRLVGQSAVDIVALPLSGIRRHLPRYL
ncbi:host attachment protein [Salinisphaera sp.]|uniref:host attachment protein n=1 Tax=Salinisphaera sp. TaxID=1914330 RepID=UPI003C7BA3E9